MSDPYETPANGDFERYVRQLMARQHQQHQRQSLAQAQQSPTGKAGTPPATALPKSPSLAKPGALQPARATAPARQAAWDEDDCGQSRKSTPTPVSAAGRAPVAARPAPSTPYLVLDASSERGAPPDMQQLWPLLQKALPAVWVVGILLFIVGGPLLLLLLLLPVGLLALPQTRQWLLVQYEQFSQQLRR